MDKRPARRKARASGWASRTDRPSISGAHGGERRRPAGSRGRGRPPHHSPRLARVTDGRSMQVQPLIITAVAGAAVWGLVEVWIHWRASSMASRARDRALHPDRYPSEPRAPLQPESGFVVRLSDSEVVCERPDGTVERVGWADLQKVEVVTTGEGPFAPDVFWVLQGADGGCDVPQGATGDRRLLERLQALPGFDNDALIAAMSSTSDRRFLCWQRPVPDRPAISC